MSDREIPDRTSSAPPDVGQSQLKPTTSAFQPSSLNSIPEYVPSAQAATTSAPAPASNPWSSPAVAYVPGGNAYAPTYQPQPSFRPPPFRQPPAFNPPPKSDSSNAFAAQLKSNVVEYVPTSTNTFKQQLQTTNYEFKPSSEPSPAAKEFAPTTTKADEGKDDEGIANIELDENSDEGISNVELDDVDLDDIAPAKEENKAPESTFSKTRAVEAREGIQEDENSQYSVESLTAKTIYSFEEVIRLGEIALKQEWEPEKRIAYFRDRAIVRIEFTYEQRNNFRDNKRHRGGKRGHNQPQGFRRTITEDQKRILEEAKRIRERLKMPQPERIAAEKKARSILNKLTPQNFEKLRNQLFDICKESEDQTTDATNAIYTRACSGNKYTEMFAMLCSFLAGKQELFFGKTFKKNQFHRALLIICEEVFRKVPADEIETEEKIQLRKKAIGNMRFLGELYKKKLITTRIALEIVTTLLEEVEEDKIEGACEFILTCTDMIAQINNEKLDNILKRMDELKDQVSARIKFRIMDVFDAKNAGWNVKKFEAGPNKISK